MTFRIDQDVLSLLTALPDIRKPGTSTQQRGSLRLLIPVSWIDVEVQAELGGLAARTGLKPDRKLTLSGGQQPTTRGSVAARVMGDLRGLP